MNLLLLTQDQQVPFYFQVFCKGETHLKADHSVYNVMGAINLPFDMPNLAEEINTMPLTRPVYVHTYVKISDISRRHRLNNAGKK